MDVSQLKDELRRDEGFENHVYDCTRGHATAGYGHNCEAAGYDPAWIESHRAEGSISREQAEEWLESDIQRAVEIARECCSSFDQLSNSRRRVLCNMAFNMGHKLNDFRRMLAAVEDQDWDKAAEEMLDSLWAEQVHDRSKRLAAMMLSG